MEFQCHFLFMCILQHNAPLLTYAVIFSPALETFKTQLHRVLALHIQTMLLLRKTDIPTNMIFYDIHYKHYILITFPFVDIHSMI